MLTSFPLASPRTGCEGRCFLLAALWALQMWSAHCTPLQAVLGQETRRRPRVFRPHTDFFSAVISSLLCFGVEFIPVVLCVSGVQELDTVPLRHSSVLFWVLFSSEVITVYSLAFPGVFSRSFWLLHLISIKVKRFIPTS